MSDSKEYDNLISQRSSAQKNYSATRSRIEECNYLIERLKKVKTVLVNQKSSFKSISKKDKEIVQKKRTWKGNTYSRFTTKGNSLMSENDSYYKNSLDYVLDAINDEITRLENQINREYGLLGELTSWINSLSNKIENFFN